MRIVYILESLEMSGGVKVIVEHAEGLASRGHDVALVTKDARHDWIPIRVSVIEVPCFSVATLPEADVHVATWFPTVVPVVNARRAARVFHFCQGYEAPHPHTLHRLDEIDEAYRQPVPKLLVSAHLEPILAPRYPGTYHVLPQAIPAADFAPPDPRRDAPREASRPPASRAWPDSRSSRECPRRLWKLWQPGSSRPRHTRGTSWFVREIRRTAST